MELRHPGSAEIYVSLELFRESKKHHDNIIKLKNTLLNLITCGYTVAVFDPSVGKPTTEFTDTQSFIYWYDNYYRLHAWFIHDCVMD